MNLKNMKKQIRMAVLAVIMTCFGWSNAQYWSDNGNNVGLSSVKLGTLNDKDLPIFTNNIQHLTLKSNGKLGLGTNNPNATFEVKYCLTPHANNGGILVTKSLCPTGFLPVMFDPNRSVETIGGPLVKEGENLNEGNEIFFPFSYRTGHTTNVFQPLMSKEGPLLWARTQGDNGWFLSQPDNFDTKFIVMPDGSCGINIAQPRAALDIRGGQGVNRPAAIIGSLAQGTYRLDESTKLPQYYTQ
ncbi:MAG: hypothetical protein COA58_16355 [Bacteroidetes bacterium]|nr:MAG: hypothetical protein COA58_16355 [Bacteroidota bacterium]